MSEMEKIFRIKSEKNNVKTVNQWKNAACGQKTTSEKWILAWNQKLGLEWTMKGLKKPFRKKIQY